MISLSPASQFTFKTTLHIRMATRQDLPLLEWYGEYQHFRRVYQKAYEDQLAGKRLMLVVDLNQFPVAQIFVSLTLSLTTANERRAYLYSLRVISHLRGLGIGTRLLSFTEQLLRQRGFHWAVISSTKDNVRARKLYERVGYRVYAEDKGEWSYENHRGERIQMYEPCWMLHKKLR